MRDKGDDSDGSSSGDEFEDPFVSWDLYRNVEHKSRDQQSGEIVYVNNVYNSKYTISKPKKPASSQKSAQTPEVSSDNLFDLQTTLPSQSSERDESMKQKQLTFPSNLLPSIPYNFASLTLEDVELQLTCSAKNGDINLDNESGQTTNETEEESSMTRISTDDKDDKLDHDSFPRFSQRFEFIQNNQSRNNTSLQVFNIQNHQFSFRDEENPQQQLPESRKVERRVTDLVPKSQQWLTVKKKGYYYKPKHKYSSNNLYKRPPIAVNLLSKTNSKSPEKNEFIDFDRLEKGVNNNYDLKISESLYLEELRHCSQSELYFKLLLNKTNNASLRESMALSIRHLPPRIAAIVDAVATRCRFF